MANSIKVPLRDEKVVVKFMPISDGVITERSHVLYGGLSSNASMTLCVPRNEYGLVNPLTDDEQRFFEHKLGLEEGALAANRINNNLWGTDNKSFPNTVILTKEDLILDLNNVTDYIKYKILLCNQQYVAPSMEAYRTQRGPLQKFVIIEETAKQAEDNREEEIINETTLLFNKYYNDINALRAILYFIEGRQRSRDEVIGSFRTAIRRRINEDPERALEVLKDKYLAEKSLILQYVDNSLVFRNGKYYFDAETNLALSFENEEATLANAAQYIATPEAGEIRARLDRQLREATKKSK